MRAFRQERRGEHRASAAAVTIRKLTDHEDDRRTLVELAERDSTKPLEGAVLVAEVEGTALAAISISDGRVIADPFSRTTELRSLLELRAAQLRRRAVTRGRPRISIRRRPARATLAGSPPGASGRLLQLPH